MKRGIILIIFLLVFLIGCGKNNIQAAVVGLETTESNIEEIKEEENLIERMPEKTAGEMIDILEKSMEIKQEAKIGTFYGEIETESTGKDALKEKTKALFEKEFFQLSVKSDKKQGARYY